MTPYARCSTRLSKARDAEHRAWITFGVEDDGTVHLRSDPRLTGKAAHARMVETLSSARDYAKELIEAAVGVQAKRFGWKDLGDRVKAALAKSSRIGTALHRPRKTQAKG